MSYPNGQPIELRGTFKNSAGALADPTTVIVRVKKPDGSLIIKTYPTDGDVIRESLGVFKHTVTGNQAGDWQYRFEGTGAVATTHPDVEFEVLPSVFVP